MHSQERGQSEQKNHEAKCSDGLMPTGFAAAQKVDPATLQVCETERGKYCCAMRKETGLQTREVLPGVLSEIARTIPFPKSMRWCRGDDRFAGQHRAAERRRAEQRDLCLLGQP